MKKVFTFILALAFLHTGANAQQWKELFNGKNFTGWKKRGGDAEYIIRDGAIVGICKANTPNTFLCTEKEYGDFILELEFMIDPDVNSGVQIRSEYKTTKDNPSGIVYGYQCEIDPSDRAWSAGIYDESRRGWLCDLRLNPAGQKAFRRNDWNKMRIEAIGNRIMTWLNGVPCANLVDDMTLSGIIALQVHSVPDQHAGSTVKWRNIRILTEDLEKYRHTDLDAIPEVNAIDNTISEKEKNEGWQLLWNGKTSDGWRGAKLAGFPEKGWKIDDGTLKVLSSQGAESANGGDIITVTPYENFELSVDFMITKGANSGIKYFVNPGLNKGEGSAIGCEFQILDDQNHPDAKLGVKGNRTLGSLYDLIPAPDDKPFLPGRYNNARIVVRGDHVEHWLNGMKIVEYDRNNQMWHALVAYSKYRDWPNFGDARAGHILLQDHGDEVSFKNIKIKRLP